MKTRLFKSLSVGAALLALSLSPAFAFTLSTSSPGASFSSAQISKAWYYHHYYHHYYYHRCYHCY